MRNLRSLILHHFLLARRLPLWEDQLDGMQHGTGRRGFHEGNHGGEAGVEDAEAEGGEGALLNSVVCFTGEAVGEEGGDGEIEKDFAGDFRREGNEGHFGVYNRSIVRCREGHECKYVGR